MTAEEDWTQGYVADVGYTFGYYQELNPLRQHLALLSVGLANPPIRSACELGFGQGVSINVHAAASDIEWIGTDFNPAQVAHAQELANVSGANLRLYDQSFAEFCSRPDLPQFDFIGLHGIWSWISDENRKAIADFVSRKIRPGGTLYISYNTQPGWAPMAPMRDLLCEYTRVMEMPGKSIGGKIDSALDFAEKLLAIAPRYARSSPELLERIKAIRRQDRNYIAHEYFNRDWVPMSFAQMGDWLHPIKLGFACSAYYLDLVSSINFRSEHQAFLNDLPNPAFRELVRDFIVNQQFRRDYWVRGTHKLSPIEQAERLRQQRVLLVKSRADVPLEVTGALGKAALNEQVCNPILDALAEQQPKR